MPDFVTYPGAVLTHAPEGVDFNGCQLFGQRALLVFTIIEEGSPACGHTFAVDVGRTLAHAIDAAHRAKRIECGEPTPQSEICAGEPDALRSLPPTQ
jgi:hypothetical protein